MARLIRNFAIVLVAVLALSYAAGSAVVWDKLTKVNGQCHPEWLANDPTRFEFEPPAPDATPDPDARPIPSTDTTPYAMPAPENVTFPSRDAAISISGWWVPADDASAPAVVVVHGHTACKRDPTVLLAAGMLHRAGISALLIDMRDHGDSTDEDGRYAGGTEEYGDVLGAWDWLQSAKRVPETRIGLLGISLGAATVLIAAGEEPRVAATWEDSSYADIGVAIRAELRRNGYPEFLEIGGVTIAKLISGDDLQSRSPLRAVEKMAGRNLYITHGTADGRLSVQYAYDLIAAATAAGVELQSWIVPGTSHTAAIRVVRDEYERRLVEFFSGTLVDNG